MRILLPALSMLLVAPVAQADVSVTIALQMGAGDSMMTQTYSCTDDATVSVQYINSGANALAVLQHEGEERIFVNVVSGSGARYASGADVWWTKGDTATLENTLADGGMLECQAQDTASSQ